MTKRTKRYGGFRIGDRVQRKDGLFRFLVAGEVVKLHLGYVSTKWFDLRGKEFTAKFMPNQLINLTRLEEERTNGAIGATHPQFKLDVKPNLPSPYTRDVYSYTLNFSNI